MALGETILTVREEKRRRSAPNISPAALATAGERIRSLMNQPPDIQDESLAAILGTARAHGHPDDVPDIIAEALKPAVRSHNIQLFNSISAYLSPRKHSWGILDGIKKLLMKGSADERNFLLEQDSGRAAWKKLFRSAEDQEAELAKRILFDYVKSKGLNPTHMLGSWEAAIDKRTGPERKEPENVPMRNMRAIQVLERFEPGITRFLQRTYGINNFGRYVGMTTGKDHPLIRQYAERNEQGESYIACIQSESDWNTSMEDPQHFQKVQQRARKGHLKTKFAETRKKRQLATLLLSMKARHGKMKGAVVTSHANSEVIAVADEDDNFGEAEIDMLMKNDQCRQQMRNCFEEDGFILIDACCAGKKGGIAQKLAKAFGIVVIASKDIGLAVDFRFVSREGDAWAWYWNTDKQVWANTHVYFPNAKIRLQWMMRRFGRAIIGR